ncbi:MAG: hypothetical protein IJI47_01505 [Eubacterium sp.]|nr:hypothetical protein [Eubacterium sp.]
MNKIYKEPKFNIVCANTEDVITTSGGFAQNNGFLPIGGGTDPSSGFGGSESTGVEL